MTWTRHLEEAPWHPRQYHDVAVFDGRMWVMEGYQSRRQPQRRVALGRRGELVRGAEHAVEAAARGQRLHQ